MEFNTQICTTREQSKRLLAMGLNPETADMHWHYTNSRSESLKWRLEPYRLTTRENFFGKIDRLATLQRKRTDGTPMTGDEVFEEIWGKDVPAWSLHRLIELLPQHIHLDDYEDTHYWLVIDPMKVIYKNSYSSWIYQCDEGGLYDKLINTIEWTIKNNHFNKEYLKQ